MNTHAWIEIIESIQGNKPAIARRLLTNPKQAHSWALRRKLVETIPIEGLKPHDFGMKVNITRRVLSDDEIRLLYEIFDKTGMRRKNALLMQLILLFGCRSGEMIQSKREHFDFENLVWTVPPENHKGGNSGKPLKRPVIPAAQAMIEEAMKLSSHKEFIFQSALKKDRERALNSASALGLPKTVMSYYQRTSVPAYQRRDSDIVPAFALKWLLSSAYSKAAISAAMIVLAACCDRDATPLTGELVPGKTGRRAFVYRPGAMPVRDMVLIAQSVIQHGIIGKAKVRKLQRHEGGNTSSEFNAFEYISAARMHLDMSRDEAEKLTMTEFQMLLAAKFPEQKGFTKEEYDAVTDAHLARQARRRSKTMEQLS